MPLRDTFSRTLHDQARPVAVWAVLIGLLTAFYMALYPSIGSIAELQRMLDSMPEAFRALFMSQGVDLTTPVGYLNVELFSFTGPLVLLAYTLSAGAGATASEEERGTIDLLLSTPVSRVRVLLEKALAIGSYTVLLGLAVLLGVVLGAVVSGVEIDVGRVLAGVTSLTLLSLAFGGIGLLIGAISGRRVVALGIGGALVLVSYVLNAMAPLVDWLAPFRPLSPFYLYIGGDPLGRGLDPLHAGLLLALALLTTGAAALAFDRRDLRT